MSTEWDNILLKDAPLNIIDGDRGRNYPKKSEFFDSGHCLFLDTKNVRSKGFDFSICHFITKEKDEILRKGKLSRNDVVMTTRGTLGNVGFFNSNVPFNNIRINSGMVIFRSIENELLPDYLYQYLRSSIFKNLIFQFSSGAAQPQLPIGDIKCMTIQLPPLPTQRKIAGILSAYDDLIENNTRRIAILEEMAQRIYKEWFVDFHYPGHENEKLVESELGKIPEGWEVNSLGKVLKNLESGSRPKGGIDSNETDIPSVGAENVLGLGKYDYSKDKYVSSEFFEGMRRGHIKSGDVLLYKDGAKLGRKSMFKDGFPHDVCCINEHVFILRTNEQCSHAYLYFWLDLPNVTRDIINLNSNAAQPGLNQAGVKSLSILIADEDTRGRFDEIVYPVLTELFCLARKNNTLRQTRDLLLPKLISGKVDVSELEIDIGAEA